MLNITGNGQGITNVSVNYDLCLFCGACVGACPTNAIFLWMSHLDIDDETCTRCERCIQVCPIGALSLTGESA